LYLQTTKTVKEHRPMRAVRLTLALAALALPLAAHASTITFSDATFNLANYTPTPNVTNGAIGTATQCATCGNLGNALEFFVIAPLIQEALYTQGFAGNAFIYNPQTQGPLASISASVDKNVTVDFAANNFGSSFHPFILQNGIYYFASIPGAPLNYPNGAGTTGYLTFAASGLTAADFLAFDFTIDDYGTGTPDFSGSTMQFGLAQVLDILPGTSAPNTFIADYDNLNLTLSQAASPVPEPSSLLLLGSGISSALLLARTRKR